MAKQPSSPKTQSPTMDPTPRQRDEQAVLRQQLQATDRLSVAGKVTSTVAHALGTPLNVIAGRAALIRPDADAQELSEHAVPFDALVQVLEGAGEFVIGGEGARLGAGDVVLMPARVPHAVRAPARFKMLLAMLRAEAP